MKLVMTLLARDEADVVESWLSFHLAAGADFVIATDNRSVDGTSEILERWASEGALHLIHEPGDDLRQTEWVTRMARLAATDFGADWVINADADEFWWPRGESLEDVLAAVPAHFGVVRGAWRNFVPRPDDGPPFFAERMTVRYCAPSFHPHPLSTHLKSVHRAAHDVRVGRGNHEAFGTGLQALRGWFPFEILHFPVRSLEHCRRKYVTQFVALEKNAEKGIPGHMAEAYQAYLAGDLDSFYAPLVVDGEELADGLANGRYVVDTRLRDRLRGLGFGGPGEAGIAEPRTMRDDAAFAAEYSALQEADLGLALGARADRVEARIAALERRRLARLRAALPGRRA